MARALARRLDRDDLAERIDEIRRRAARSETVVCVVGEFKKGKSALVNALLGAPVCPVDDDLATTAVTVVRHGETPGAIIHRREDGEPVIESIDPDAARGLDARTCRPGAAPRRRPRRGAGCRTRCSKVG